MKLTDTCTLVHLELRKSQPKKPKANLPAKCINSILAEAGPDRYKGFIRNS